MVGLLNKWKLNFCHATHSSSLNTVSIILLCLTILLQLQSSTSMLLLPILPLCTSKSSHFSVSNPLLSIAVMHCDTMLCCVTLRTLCINCKNRLTPIHSNNHVSILVCECILFDLIIKSPLFYLFIFCFNLLDI